MALFDYKVSVDLIIDKLIITILSYRIKDINEDRVDLSFDVVESPFGATGIYLIDLHDYGASMYKG